MIEIRLNFPLDKDWTLEMTRPYVSTAAKFKEFIEENDMIVWKYGNIKICRKLLIQDNVKLFLYAIYLNEDIKISSELVAYAIEPIEMLARILYVLDHTFLKVKRNLCYFKDFEFNKQKMFEELMVEAPGYSKDKKLSSDKREEIRNKVLAHYNLNGFNSKMECRIPKDVTILYCKFVIGATYKDIREILQLTTHPIRRIRELTTMLVEEPSKFDKILEKNPWPNELTKQTIKQALNIL